MIQVMREDFKRFEFFAGHNISKSFSTIELLPSVCLVIDNQINETWIYHDENENILCPSEIAVSIILNWLGFYLDFELHFKTNKPLRDEKN